MSCDLGIILAGGEGTRLRPLTQTLNKHLLIVHDKPMLHYAVAMLIRWNVSKIVIVVRSQDLAAFEQIYGDGNRWGIQISFVTQPEPKGIVDGYRRAVALLPAGDHWFLLGDNLFLDEDCRSMASELQVTSGELLANAAVFSREHPRFEEFGVVVRSSNPPSIRFVEKPRNSVSREVLAGVYRLGPSAARIAAQVVPSERGELEIVDLLNLLSATEAIQVSSLPDDIYWLDLGTHEALETASQVIKRLQESGGVPIGAPEWEAFQIGRIDRSTAERLSDSVAGSYGGLLRSALAAS